MLYYAVLCCAVLCSALLCPITLESFGCLYFQIDIANCHYQIKSPGSLSRIYTVIMPDNTVIYILIANSGTNDTSSSFATVNTHANVFFVFLPGGISKEWRHIVSANCYFEGETGPIVPMFTAITGLSGNTWPTAKIAHGSHNDVRRL